MFQISLINERLECIMVQQRFGGNLVEIEKKLNFLLFINVVIILTLSGIFSGRLYTFIKAVGATMWYIYPEG